MDASSNSLAKQGHSFSDKAADALQSGITHAQNNAKQAGDRLSDKVEGARSAAGPLIEGGAERVQAVVRQGLDTLNAATKRVRASASDVGDSVVSYTQDNPVKAILISAAVGAAVATMLSAFASSRD